MSAATSDKGQQQFKASREAKEQRQSQPANNTRI